MAVGGLFFAVWCIYLLDRLWDIRKSRSGYPLTLRHQFAVANPRLLLGLSISALVAAFFLILPEFDRTRLRSASALGLVVIFYFLMFRFLRQSPLAKGWAQKIPGKELAIGICFSAGIFIASNASLRSVASIILFVAVTILFSVNCLLIAEAEISIDRDFDSASFFVRNNVSSLPYSLLLAIPTIGGGILLLFGIFPFSAISLLFCSVVTLLIAFKRFRPDPLRVQPVADSILLFPWLAVGTWFLCGQV